MSFAELKNRGITFVRDFLFGAPARAALVVRPAETGLSLDLFRAGRLIRSQVLDLSGSSPEAIGQRTGTFLQGEAPCDLVLVVPRAEVLQKEIQLSPSPGLPLRQTLDAHLQTALPFSVREMAWGLDVEEHQDKLEGILIAAPERKIRDFLEVVRSAGLTTCGAEVISEDQALGWVLPAGLAPGPVLILEKNDTRVLAVFSDGARMVFSRTFAVSAGPEFLDEEALQDLSLELLKSPLRLLSLLLCGFDDGESRHRLARYFGVPASCYQRPAGIPEPVSAAAIGASLFAGRSYISLLPRDEKAVRKQAVRLEWRRSLSRSLAAVFMIACLVWGVRLGGLGLSALRLEHQWKQMAGPASEAGQRVVMLQQIRRAQESKERVLGLMKALAGGVPSSIRLLELNVEEAGILFSAESPSYAAVSETVQVMQEIPLLRSAKLRATRLRKNRGQEVLEFEVEALWNP